jgi:hypothetical protein
MKEVFGDMLCILGFHKMSVWTSCNAKWEKRKCMRHGCMYSYRRKVI